MSTSRHAIPPSCLTSGTSLLAVVLIASSCGGPSGPAKPETIFEATAQAHLEAAQEMLEKDPAIANQVDESPQGRKRTPLFSATSVEMAQLLIDHGADVSALDRFQWTPLHTAANADIVTLLIARGAKPNAEGQRQFTPLHTVEHGDAASALIGKGAKIDPSDVKHSPLYWQIHNGHTDVVKVLLAHGAKTKWSSGMGKTLLHLAGDRDSPEVVNMLIDRGMNVNAPDKVKATPLHYAVLKDRTDVAEALLKRGAKVNAQLAKDAVITSFGATGHKAEKSVSEKMPIEIATSDAMKALLVKYGAKSSDTSTTATTTASATPPPPSPRKTDTASTPKTAPSPPSGPTTRFVGRSLKEVKKALGKPSMVLEKGGTVILLYPGREITSQDGKTVQYDDAR